MERRVYVSPSEFPIFEAALEALQEQERQRIEHMREGIAAARGEPADLGNDIPTSTEQRRPRMYSKNARRRQTGPVRIALLMSVAASLVALLSKAWPL